MQNISTTHKHVTNRLPYLNCDSDPGACEEAESQTGPASWSREGAELQTCPASLNPVGAELQTCPSSWNHDLVGLQICLASSTPELAELQTCFPSWNHGVVVLQIFPASLSHGLGRQMILAFLCHDCYFWCRCLQCWKYKDKNNNYKIQTLNICKKLKEINNW